MNRLRQFIRQVRGIIARIKRAARHGAGVDA